MTACCWSSSGCRFNVPGPPLSMFSLGKMFANCFRREEDLFHLTEKSPFFMAVFRAYGQLLLFLSSLNSATTIKLKSFGKSITGLNSMHILALDQKSKFMSQFRLHVMLIFFTSIKMEIGGKRCLEIFVSQTRWLSDICLHFLVSLPTQPRDSEQDLVFRLFELWKTLEVKASAWRVQVSS